jgi:addiction module HigA family antidote
VVPAAAVKTGATRRGVATRGRARRPPRLALPARMPPHPGQFLETRFLKPLGITQTALAEALGVSRRRVNELIRGHRAITPDTAVRLGTFFGNDAAFWMHLQVAWDMRAAVRNAYNSGRR